MLNREEIHRRVPAMTEPTTKTNDTLPASGASATGTAPAEVRPARRKGGRPKKTGTRRTARLEVVLTPAEKAEMVQTAQSAGLSVAELVRRRVLGRPVRSKADAEARRSLRRIGGNLNQIARRLNTAAGTPAAAPTGVEREVAEAVAELRAAVASLADGGER